jgi:iron complex outermembrane recepter protein
MGAWAPRWEENMKFKDVLLFTALTSALLSGQGIANAQTADDPVDKLEDEEKEAVVLGTVTVSARKRDEALIDVPLSVSALGSEEIELLVLDGIADYLRQLPGASLVNAGPEYLNDISIRGQGGGRQGFNESAVGIYRNGIYVAGGGFGGRSFNRLDFFDVRTIETYRGPQGALYGRNAVGGAMNVISNKPSTEAVTFDGRVAFEDIDRYEVSGVLNLPLAETFAARIGAFFIDQDGGFHTNLPTGKKTDVQEQTGARIGLLMQPDHGNDRQHHTQLFKPRTQDRWYDTHSARQPGRTSDRPV